MHLILFFTLQHGFLLSCIAEHRSLLPDNIFPHINLLTLPCTRVYIAPFPITVFRPLTVFLCHITGGDLTFYEANRHGYSSLFSP